MDHWGDPWADDADADTNLESEAPAKLEVASPVAASFAPVPAPIVLNGFLDEARWGWGEEEEGGRWAVSPKKDGDKTHDEREHAMVWDGRRGSEERLGENEWSRIEEEVEEGKEADTVVEERSDSATTIQPDDASDDPHARTASGIAESLHRDDDASTRASSSPSDGSHHEAATESPRTSVEEERAAGKFAGAAEGDYGKTMEVEGATQRQGASEPEADDDFGDFEDEVAQQATASRMEADAARQNPEPSSVEPGDDAANDVRELTPKAAEGMPGSFALDRTLLAELFPPAKGTTDLEEPPDDPVSSISTRKAWYRVTRKQTMREFNSGSADDNYIRVTWKTSHIKSEVTKTVARWATEDRMAGRGPGARASFFWDTTSAPPDEKAPFHLRKKTNVSVSNPVGSEGQTAQRLSTELPASFNWSSPSSAAWHALPDNSATRSTSLPATAKHRAVATLQGQGGRAASVDLTPIPREPLSHKRTSTTTDFPSGAVTATTSLPMAPIQAPISEHDPWANLETFDTSLSSKEETGTAEDDDDWGDMVESPVVSTTQAPVWKSSDPPTRNYTPSTTPVSVKSSPLQAMPVSAGPKHASPIVRLKGVVSPTSAVFKPNALVPTDTKEPIGPGLLKPRNRSREPTPEKQKPIPVELPTMDGVLDQESAEAESREKKLEKEESEAEVLPDATLTKKPPVVQYDPIPAFGTQSPGTALNPSSSHVSPQPEPSWGDEAGFSAFETSLPDPVPVPPSSPPPPTTQPTLPSWGDDADFSIFESAVPAPAPAPVQPPIQTDPLDPWSIFDSPAVPAASQPPVTSTRPPARSLTPPVIQPLTAATSSAQRRKAEEDEIVRSIVEGLPDLAYMLKR